MSFDNYSSAMRNAKSPEQVLSIGAAMVHDFGLNNNEFRQLKEMEESIFNALRNGWEVC